VGRSGRATAQAVSRRLPTAAARVQTRVGTWDFVMGKSGAEAGFLRELRFPLPIYIPSCSPQSSSLSLEAGTIGQEWPQCLVSHSPKKKKKWAGHVNSRGHFNLKASGEEINWKALSYMGDNVI
jgi:hypothetical protein